MTLQQLRYLVAIAEYGSINAAATNLFASQSNLSTAVRDLEREFGITIFTRSNRGVTPTNEGTELLGYARQVLEQADMLENRYTKKGAAQLRLAVSTQHYTFSIRAFTEMIKKAQPERFVFSIHETRTRDVLEDVKNLRSEVGIVSFSGSNEAVLKKLFRDYQLEFTPLMTRDTYVYVWKGHELAGRKEISIEEMRGYPCVSFDQSDDSSFYLTEEAMADYDFDKMIKSDDRATSMEIIAELGGYAIGSGMLSDEQVILQGLTAIKLKEEDPLVIGYITRKGHALSTYGERYLEELLKYKEL